jgi:hypothetical protein
MPAEARGKPLEEPLASIGARGFLIPVIITLVRR